MARQFRMRIRPWRAVLGFGTEEGFKYEAGQEVVVSEQIAADMLRHRAAELVEPIDDDAQERRADVEPAP